MSFLRASRKQIPTSISNRIALGLVLAAMLTGTLFQFASRGLEPVYHRKTLTQWLHNDDLDFVGMPNDFYGHIHNELWDAVVAGGYAARENDINQAAISSFNSEPDPAIVATRQLGTNAIPRLLELVAARPSAAERGRDSLAPKLPAVLSRFLLTTRMIPTAEWRHWAGLKGFEALGTNAEVALPALSNLLQRPGSDFQLGGAIQSVGPSGTGVLVNALTNSDRQARDVAAFCLGNDPQARTSALPVLVNLVEHGQASYQVLGAIGRLGGDAELVVPALTSFVQGTSALSSCGFETDMAILILGLYREKARSTLPVLAGLYPNADKTTRQVIRLVIKNIDLENTQQLLGRAPSAKDDQDPWWGGAQD